KFMCMGQNTLMRTQDYYRMVCRNILEQHSAMPFCPLLVSFSLLSAAKILSNSFWIKRIIKAALARTLCSVIIVPQRHIYAATSQMLLNERLDHYVTFL